MKTVAFTVSRRERDLYLRERYVGWLAKISPQIVPVLLPMVSDRAVIREYARRFDGFIFTGGDDVDPALYSEEKKKACGAIDRLRDEFELSLMGEVMKLGKPTLGICRGMQVMNVALGGTLWQDIPSSGFESHAEISIDGTPRHTVRLSGKLRDIMSAERIVTNSYHHQSVKRLGTGLEAAAQSDDGLIEGIWKEELRFFCGVQWHPEMGAYEHSARLIERFAMEL